MQTRFVNQVSSFSRQDVLVADVVLCFQSNAIWKYRMMISVLICKLIISIIWLSVVLQTHSRIQIKCTWFTYFIFYFYPFSARKGEALLWCLIAPAHYLMFLKCSNSYRYKQLSWWLFERGHYFLLANYIGQSVLFNFGAVCGLVNK